MRGTHDATLLGCWDPLQVSVNTIITAAGAYKGPLELEKLRAYAHGAAHYWQPKKGHWIWENIKVGAHSA